MSSISQALVAVPQNQSSTEVDLNTPSGLNVPMDISMSVGTPETGSRPTAPRDQRPENPYERAAERIDEMLGSVIPRPNDINSSPRFKDELLRHLSTMNQSSNFSVNGVDYVFGRLGVLIRDGADLSTQDALYIMRLAKDAAHSYATDSSLPNYSERRAFGPATPREIHFRVITFGEG